MTTKISKILAILIIILSPTYAQISSKLPDSLFIFVKGGTFIMGNNNGQYDEKPPHKVKISDFYITKTEITYAQFVKFLNEKGNKFQGNTTWIDLNGKWRTFKCPIYEKNGKFYVKPGYENYPVAFVSWWGAQAFCKWAGGRLPTEAEWEYLAKLYSKDTISIQQLNQIAFFKENSGYHPNPVAQKLPTPPQIYDLFGNQAEWCYDWYNDNYYKNSKRKNPLGPPNGTMKVVRGGSWATKAKSISPTNRRAAGPDNNNITIGFRCVIPTYKWKDFPSNSAAQYGHEPLTYQPLKKN